MEKILRCKALWLVIGSIALILAAGRLIWVANDGFNISHIQQRPADFPIWTVKTLTPDELANVKHILDQRYSYMAKGHQSYVFLSEDGQYVVKFLKFKRYQFTPAYSAIFPGRAQKGFKKLTLLLQSWAIAFNDLQEENGLVYVHLNPSGIFEKPLNIVDRLGFSYDIDLDHTVFLVQKKAEVFGPYIRKVMASGDVEQAKQVIDKLISLYEKEYSLGIYEVDRHIDRNMGVLGTMPICIDQGQLAYDGTIKDPAELKEKLVYKTAYLQEWLDEDYPELGNHLKNRLK